MLAGRPDLARQAADETALRAACMLPGYEWDYLRFVREDEVWRPAAGVAHAELASGQILTEESCRESSG